MNQDDIVKATQRWLETIVVDLNLCPFAKKEMVNKRIRYSVSEAVNIGQLLESLQLELGFLQEKPEIETILLIHPKVLSDFLDYNQFLDAADELLVQLELDGIFQIASFHPDYQFAGTEPDDVENYSNRSPYPLLHILREDSLENVIEEYPDTENIPDRNIQLLEEMGIDKMRSLLKACIKK